MDTKPDPDARRSQDLADLAIGKVVVVRMLLAWAIPMALLWVNSWRDFSHPHWLLGQYLLGGIALLLLLGWFVCHLVLRSLRRVRLHHYLIAYFIMVQPIFIPIALWMPDGLPNTLWNLGLGGGCFIVYWFLFYRVLKRVRF